MTKAIGVICNLSETREVHSVSSEVKRMIPLGRPEPVEEDNDKICF
jgi:hypothetical protein